MAWFALARVLFAAAVAYAAAILRPLPVGGPGNVGFALGLAVLVIFLETRLRDTSATRLLGALIGSTIGLASCTKDGDVDTPLWRREPLWLS